MNGIFSFAIYDSTDDKYFIARDHIGIIPLYIGWDSKGTFYVSSELKSLESNCEKIELFQDTICPAMKMGTKSGILEIGSPSIMSK